MHGSGLSATCAGRCQCVSGMYGLLRAQIEHGPSDPNSLGTKRAVSKHANRKLLKDAHRNSYTAPAQLVAFHWIILHETGFSSRRIDMKNRSDPPLPGHHQTPTPSSPQLPLA
eukprot:TRINITY_DN12311_c0_g2_i1.p1 TRINITY_DN12311_c0_g2~~TRINITY_DN12311_c0_g2_i1.p1  ORF type:complete len:113 (-),score=5.01 TRINITY_DN12311_c0_g2_i1:67-405(-)